jgi:hypothetical protein
MLDLSITSLLFNEYTQQHHTIFFGGDSVYTRGKGFHYEILFVSNNTSHVSFSF